MWNNVFLLLSAPLQSSLHCLQPEGSGWEDQTRKVPENPLQILWETQQLDKQNAQPKGWKGGGEVMGVIIHFIKSTCTPWCEGWLMELLSDQDYLRPSVESILQSSLLASAVAEEQSRTEVRLRKRSVDSDCPLQKPAEPAQAPTSTAELKMKEQALRDREKSLKEREERLERKTFVVTSVMWQSSFHWCCLCFVMYFFTIDLANLMFYFPPLRQRENRNCVLVNDCPTRGSHGKCFRDNLIIEVITRILCFYKCL